MYDKYKEWTKYEHLMSGVPIILSIPIHVQVIYVFTAARFFVRYHEVGVQFL